MRMTCSFASDMQSIRTVAKFREILPTAEADCAYQFSLVPSPNWVIWCPRWDLNAYDRP